MGIEDYWNVILELFPQAFSRHPIQQRRPFDHVLIDLNHVLYQLGNSSVGDDELVEMTIDHLDKMLATFPPQKSIFIALDGPGPRAKMLTQRERREKSADRDAMHALRFTPGTEFMHKLNLGLCTWAARRASSPRMRGKIFVSGSEREGEGEFKMFQHLLHIEQLQDFGEMGHLKATKPVQGDTALLVGGDSDLVVSGLRAQIVKHMKLCVLRMPSRFAFELYDLSILSHALFEKLHGDPLDLVDDLIVLSLFSGSDYVPRVFGYVLKNAFVQYRSLKSQENNKHKHLVERITDPETGEIVSWKLNSAFLAETLRVADHSSLVYDVLLVHVADKTKKLVLSRKDVKSNLNTLCAALVKQSQLHYMHRNNDESKGRVAASAVLIMVTGEHVTLGTGYGHNKRAAEKEAAVAALHPSGIFMTKIVQERILPEEYKLLDSYIRTAHEYASRPGAEPVLETGDASAEDGPAVLGVLDQIPGTELMARKAKTRANNEAIRSANSPAVVMEYLRMTIWTLEYYRGICRGYDDAFHYVGAPSVEFLLHAVSKSPIVIPVKDNRVLTPGAFWNPAPPRELEQEMADRPLNPTEFFVALMPPVSLAVKVLPELLREPVLQFRDGRHRDILGMTYDQTSGSVSFFDEVVEFKNTIESALVKLDEPAKKTAGAFLQFSPSYVFFRPDAPSSSELSKYRLTLDPVLKSPFAWQRVISWASAFADSNSTAVCLAEEPDHLKEGQDRRHRLRKFSVLPNAFMQKRMYSTTFMWRRPAVRHVVVSHSHRQSVKSVCKSFFSLLFKRKL